MSGDTTHGEDDDVVNALPVTPSPVIEHADALDWLAAIEPDSARAVVYDPPYSRGTRMHGLPDGAAGRVAAPFSFMHRTLELAARAVMPDGVVICFGDWELLPDLAYLASISGLREQSHLVWTRSRPGGGWLFRSACDPVLIASRTSPDRVSAAAVRNWFAADYEVPRAHPYSKPPELIAYILARVCRRGDTVLDPFAGSGSSRVAAEKLGLDLVWKGADIDPQYAETTSSATARSLAVPREDRDDTTTERTAP